MPPSAPTAREVLDALHEELLPLLASALQDLDELDPPSALLDAARAKLEAGFLLAREHLMAVHSGAADQSAADALRKAAASALQPTGVLVVVHAPEFVRIPHQHEIVLVAEELCRNVARSGAGRCDVHLHVHDRYVSLIVHDDGGDSEELEQGRETIANVCARIAGLRGRASWQRPATGGTRARITVAL